MFKRLIVSFAALLLSGCLVIGCGGPSEPEGHPVRAPEEESGAEKASASGKVDSASRQTLSAQDLAGDVSTSAEPRSEEPASGAPISPSPDPEETLKVEPEPPKEHSLAETSNVADAAGAWIPDLARVEVDEARAAAAGIRKLSGRRLTLFTDLASEEEVDALPEVFDQAFGQWCEYFGIDPADHAKWKMTGFLIGDRQRFLQVGLLPGDLPPFEHGYSWNYELWLYEQPSAYYRRHLLLHEGTHSFMNTMLGACGPPWYMEGIAELLATHRWRDGRLALNHVPADREEVPMWGRIKIIKDAFAAGKALYLEDIIAFRISAHRKTEPYAWCWAAAVLLDRHPGYRDRFRQLYRFVAEADFSERFYRLIGDDWDPLSEQWHVFVANLEYGHDVPKTAIDFTPGERLPEGGTSVAVAADRGWQNSGLRLEAGVTYQLRAQGRYQIADQPQIWWCEPGGVSIRYYRGLPLGILLAAVQPEVVPPGQPRPLIRPAAVGLGTTLTPSETGTLYLRINDSAGELDDNAGSLSVQIRPMVKE